MVGKAALLECLENPEIKQILLVNRRPLGMQHPKLREVFLDDFTKPEAIRDEFSGIDACFYCMGVSAVGMSEEDYHHVTFDTTKAFANLVFEISPGAVFIYVSGIGTDSSEKGRTMWARVKGKTENMVLNKGFKDAYAFRPGIILPEKEIKSKTGWYNLLYIILWPLFPLLRLMNSITTTTRLGQAMIGVVLSPENEKHLYNADFNRMTRP